MTRDQYMSLAVAVVGGLLSLILPKRWAITPLALSLCLFPSMLLVPPKDFSLTPQRWIGMVLLVRCVLQGSIRQTFRWRWVDTAAVFYYLCVTISVLMAVPHSAMSAAINNRLGFFLSAMIPFWCVRFLIVDRQSFNNLVSAWLWAAIPLAILGLDQMVTGDSPYFKLMEKGIIWKGAPNTKWDMRPLFGRMYFRASAPFLQFIMYGWFFALQTTWITNLYWKRKSFLPWIIPACFIPIGVYGSISNGPLMMMFFAAGFIALFPLRRHWKIGFGTVGALWLLVVLMANRSPMEFMAEWGKDQASSWYRVRLQQFTLNGPGMKGHWVVGYGDVPPQYIEFHDLCIHWVWLLVVHGIVGLVGYYTLVGTSAYSMWRAKRVAQSTEDQWLLWSLLATLCASLLGMLLVTLFSEMYFIYHMVLGVFANSDLIVKPGTGGERQVGVLVEQNGQRILYRYHLKAGQRLAVVTPNAIDTRPAVAEHA